MKDCVIVFKKTDDMLITKILTILPPQYKHFESAWDSTSEENKTLENLRARLLKEEEGMKIRSSNQSGSVAFHAKKFNGNCDNCGKYSHKRADCRSNSGKSKQEQKKNQNTLSFKHCNKCNKNGHSDEYCWKDKNFPECKYCKKTNHPEDKCKYKEEHELRRKNACPTSIPNNKVCFFTEAHLIDSDNLQGVDTSFVVDSGSTNHLTHEKKLLFDVKKTDMTSIGCAKKGTQLVSKVSGSVEEETVILTNASLVPELSRNLLSVNEVTKRGSVAVFDKDKVVIVQGSVTHKEENIVLKGNNNKMDCILWTLKVK